jgi:CrcB protein
LRELLVIGFGGFCGAIARYTLSGWVHRWVGSTFPWGTLTVNIAGCFTLGALMALVEGRLPMDSDVRLFLAIGVLGSLTTFSTFSYETVELLRRSEAGLALASAGGHLLLGLGAVVLGHVLGAWATG